MSQTATSRDRGLSRILADRGAARASGILRATRGRMRRLFCLQDGMLVYAVSNVIEEQVEEYFVRHGILTPAQKAVAIDESARSKKKFTRALVDTETLPELDVRDGVGRLVATLFESSMEWPDGNFEFESGRPNLDGEVTAALRPAELILAFATRFPKQAGAVRMAIGPPDARPALVPDRRAVLESARLGEEALFLLDRCDGSLTVPELIGAVGAGEETTLRTLYGLLLLGVVTVDRVAPSEKRVSSAPPLQRDECLAILPRANASDHYALLGLTRTAPADEIRRSYYALARRYHPDRFRAGALGDLLPRFEHFFSLVTEAYNTLMSPELRAQYDEQIKVSAEPESQKLSETAHLARENYTRGKLMVERRRFTEAVTFLENAVRMDPNQSAYNLELGLLLAKNPRRRADAERLLIRAVEIEPTRVAAYVALGEMYQRAGKPAHAARMFREVMRWEPDHVEASQLLHGVKDATGEVEFLRPVFES